MRPLLASLLVLFFVPFESTAGDEFLIRWDCNFSFSMNTRQNCANLRQQLFELPILDEGNRDEAEVSLNVFASDTPNGVRYRFQVEQLKAFRSGRTLRPLELTVHYVASQMTLEEEGLNLVYDMIQILTPFLRVKDMELSRGGVSLELGGQSDAPGGSETDGARPWYVTTTVAGNYSDDVIRSFLLQGGATFNLSKRRWRVRATGGINYVRDAPRGGDANEIFEVNGLSVVSHSIDSEGHWNVALMLSVDRSTPENVDIHAQSYLAAEWILVPYLKNTGVTGGVRYFIGYEYQDYRRTTTDGQTSRHLIGHALELFLTYRHQNWMTLRLGGNAYSPIVDYDFAQAGATGSLSIDVSHYLSIGPSLSVLYRRRALNAPNLEGVDPSELILGGAGGFGEGWVTSASLFFTFRFGNSVLFNTDQRMLTTLD